MHPVPFREQDGRAGTPQILGVGEGDLHGLGAESREDLRRPRDGVEHTPVDTLGHQVRAEPHPQARDAPGEEGAGIGDLMRPPTIRHDGEHEGRVLDRAREWADGIEAWREGVNAVERCPPVGGLEPDDTGAGGWVADRAAGIGPRGARAQIAGHGGRRAAARPTDRAREVPGIAGRPVPRVVGERTFGELVEVGLADGDGTRGGEPRHDGGIHRRHAREGRMRAIGRGHAGDVDDVLVGDGDAVERPAVAAVRDLGLGRAGFRARPLGREGDKGVECLLEAVTAIQIGLGQLDRRDLPPRDQRRQSGDAQQAKLLGCHRRPLNPHRVLRSAALQAARGCRLHTGRQGRGRPPASCASGRVSRK